jgi:hypothetical protein
MVQAFIATRPCKELALSGAEGDSRNSGFLENHLLSFSVSNEKGMYAGKDVCCLVANKVIT